MDLLLADDFLDDDSPRDYDIPITPYDITPVASTHALAAPVQPMIRSTSRIKLKWAARKADIHMYIP